MSEARVVHLMRHGEPVLTGRLLGHTDCAVTPQGIDACIAAAATLSPTRILASDLARASDCARAVAGQAVTGDPRWRELDFGDWDGRAASDLDQSALAAFWRDPDAAPPPRGERWSDLVKRVSAALDDLVDDTLVVTHAGAMRATLAAACGFDATQVWAFDLPYACVLTLRLWRWEPPKAQIVGLR